MYTLRIPPRVQKFIKDLPERYRRSAIEALEEIKLDPSGGKPLKRDLKNKFSYRIGVFRIVYKIKDRDKIVEVLKIGHRRDVYN